MRIPPGFKLIPNTDRYALAGGFVYNLKTGKKLRRFFDGYKTRTAVVTLEQKTMLFDHDLIDKPPAFSFSREYILEKEGARIIEDYSDYAITSYGALWCINPRKKGPKAGMTFFVQTHSHQEKICAWLADPVTRKIRKRFRIYHLTKNTWGDECTYDENW